MVSCNQGGPLGQKAASAAVDKLLSEL